MEPEFWSERWEVGQIGFHVNGVHPDLVGFGEEFLSGGPHRVLVPLSGKSHDLTYLAERGHQAVGVELVRTAVEQFFAEQRFALKADPDVAEDDGGSTWSAGGVTVHNRDVLTLTPDVVGMFDRVWDRAAIVALDPERRRRYAQVIRRLVRPGGQILVNAFTYDQSQMPGPPHSVPEDELRAHYDGWEFEVIRHGQPITEGKFAERGVSEFRVNLFRVTRPA